MRFVPCTCAADDPIRDERTIRLTYRTRDEARKAWATYQPFNCGDLEAGLRADLACCHWHAGRRYWVICGPLGHLVGV